MTFTDSDLEIMSRDGSTQSEARALARELLAYRQGDIPLTDADLSARIHTITGWLHPLAPRPGELTIEAIARGLSTQIRYKGQTRRPYTVAEHSVIVSLLVEPAHAREALLHDASEAFLCDMASPVKRTPSMAAYRRIEDTLQQAVYAAFNVVPTEASAAAVYAVDQRLCSDEMPQLLIDPGPELTASVIERCGQPFGLHIAALPIAPAETLFLARYKTLFPERL